MVGGGGDDHPGGPLLDVGGVIQLVGDKQGLEVFGIIGLQRLQAGVAAGHLPGDVDGVGDGVLLDAVLRGDDDLELLLGVILPGVL